VGITGGNLMKFVNRYEDNCHVSNGWEDSITLAWQVEERRCEDLGLVLLVLPLSQFSLVN
jgi:hypothetical protein